MDGRDGAGLLFWLTAASEKLVSSMGRTVPLVERLLLADKLLIGGCAKEGGRKLSLFCCYTLVAGLRLYKAGWISMKRELSPDEERMRLAKWLSKGEIYDPRNEEEDRKSTRLNSSH